jgi:phage baseplate assembly protein W
MPAGLGPAGLGTPLSVADPPTGTAGVRFLNPATRDYQVDSVSGQLAQMPSLRQRVLLALMTTQASASVQPKFGLNSPRKIDGNFTANNEQRIREALRQMTEVEKVMKVTAIKTERGVSGSNTARVRTTVSYTDLTTGTNGTVNV